MRGDASVACSCFFLVDGYVMGGARELALFDGAIGVYPLPLFPPMIIEINESHFSRLSVTLRPNMIRHTNPSKSRGSLGFCTSVIQEALWRLSSCSLLVAQSLMGRIQ